MFATPAGIAGGDVHDLVVAALEHRFGSVSRLPGPIEGLTDNGSGYLARETRLFAREDGPTPRTTSLEGPQPKRVAEAFVRTLKHNYVRVSGVPDAKSVLCQVLVWFAHYNTLHPLGYRAPRAFIAQPTQEIPIRSLGGNNSRRIGKAQVVEMTCATKRRLVT